MPLRVIAGIAKGRRLNLVPGDSTRPVMDRVKEACFSILGRKVYDARVLDLFAGTGSVGIEALSRGAESAVFVELDRRAVETIQSNLALTGLGEQATIRRADVLRYLKKAPAAPFDLIYIAPPQYRGLWQDCLRVLDEVPGWTHDDSIIIVQIDPNEQEAISLRHYATSDERRYGNTLLWFFGSRDEEG
jgi:16S rRNA (guanine(966)-N(2))-methyltransferase RsmD